MKKLRADLVFSKGGYVVVPVGLAARRRRIPIVTHDSDVVPGLANRIIGRWAKINATGMPAKYYDYPESKVRYTGVPLDPRLKKVSEALQADYKRSLGLKTNDQVVVAAGGGLGSVTINQLLVNSSPDLLGRLPNLHLFHFTGGQHLEEIKKAYVDKLSAEMLKRVHLESFVSDYYRYTGAADVVISRAGATSIPELAAQAKACIIIPAPWIPGGQQLRNAEVLVENQAAAVEDNDISSTYFSQIAFDLLSNKPKRQKLASNLNKLAKYDASAKLAAIILETVGPGNDAA